MFKDEAPNTTVAAKEGMRYLQNRGDDPKTPYLQKKIFTVIYARQGAMLASS